MSDCVFCAIGRGEAPADVVREWEQVIAIRPHRPVVPGHVLIIPKIHVADAAENPAISALTMLRACMLAQSGRQDFNIITSAGSAATQSVFHLHLHLVPREPDDGLALPWTGQQK